MPAKPSPSRPRPPEPQRPPGPIPPTGLLDEYVDDPWEREHNAMINEADHPMAAIRERCYKAGYLPVAHHAA